MPEEVPPPPTTIPVNCSAVAVAGAPVAGVDGLYRATSAPPAADGTREYKKDAGHVLYRFHDVWKIKRPSDNEVFVRAAAAVPGQGRGVPCVWGACSSVTAKCQSA